MSRTGSTQRILGDFEKSVSWELDTELDGWLSLARGDLYGRCHTCWGKGEDETFNSMLIKGFVPELRSRYVFFRISYVLSFWTFDVRFTFSHIMAMVQNQMTRTESDWLYPTVNVKDHVLRSIFEGIFFQTPSNRVFHCNYTVGVSCSQFPARSVIFCLLVDVVYWSWNLRTQR